MIIGNDLRLQAAVLSAADDLRNEAKHPENRDRLLMASQKYNRLLTELQALCEHVDVEVSVVETTSFPFIAAKQTCNFCGKEV